MERYGKIFLKGNIENGDLDKVKNKLAEIGVKYTIQGSILWFEKFETYKLPKDIEGCPYIPVGEKGGFAYYPISSLDIRDFGKTDISTKLQELNKK